MANTTSPLYQSPESGRAKHPEHEVHKHVEDFLRGRVLSLSATPVVEEVLFDQALLHHLVYAGRGLASSLQRSGFSVQIQYCTSAAHGHPVPFLITKDQNGELVVPTGVSHDANCSRSTFYIVQCSTTDSEDSRHAIPPGPSETPTIAQTKGAVVVVPKPNHRACELARRCPQVARKSIRQ